MRKIELKDLVYNAVIAGLYVVLTLVSFPVSFCGIQFRIAEILLILCFFRKDYSFGLIIGCFLANLFSPIGLLDALFGTAATVLSCLLIMFSKHLLTSVFAPVIFNSFVVGFELYYFLNEPFWLSCLTVGLGELAVMLLAYIFCLLIKKNDKFLTLIRANQNIGFKF